MRDPRPGRTAIVLLALALAVAAVPEAGAQQQPDFSGTWSLEIEAIEPVPEAAASAALVDPKQGAPCLYSGTVDLSQDGDQVSGPAELFLDSGPESCPAEMSGNLTGTLSTGEAAGTTTINGFIDGVDPSGVTSFFGILSPNPGGSGGFDVTQGDFVGTTGTWTAVLQELSSAIPGLGPIGLALLTALLLAAGAWILARSQPA